MLTRVDVDRFGVVLIELAVVVPVVVVLLTGTLVTLYKSIISSAAFSANIITGAFKFAFVTSGITEASTIRKLDTPRTLKCNENVII